MIEHLVDVATDAGPLGAVLHLPAQRRAPPVLIVPDAMGDRIGPWRMSVRIARRLCASGQPVLRYDSAGVGESDGAPPSSNRTAGSAERSVRRDEVVAAAGELLRATGAERALVVSVGAGVDDAAALARSMPHGLAGVFAIGPPIDLGRSPAASSRSWAKRSLRMRMSRLLDRDAWRRIWRGDADITAILEELGTVASGARRTDVASLVGSTTWAALRALRARGVPVALAWSEHDPSGCIYRDVLKGALAAPFETHILPGADEACARGDAFEAVVGLIAAFSAR